MTEQQLLALCSTKGAETGKAPWIYWPVELYSHGKYLREFGCFPKHLPLCMYGDHSGGVVGTEMPAKHELETDAPGYLTFSRDKATTYQKMTGKNAYVILSPAVYYRRKSKIVQSQDHKGTVAFCVHSVPGTDTIVDYVKFGQALMELPEKFQPITVCLHMHDVDLGVHKIFLDLGMNVVTAGNTSDYRFIERFYGILRTHSFATSNFIGAYSTLAVEMGIPFFIYCDSVAFNNHTDQNIPVGLSTGYDGYPYYKKLHDAFTFPNLNVLINPVLKREIEEHLGVYDSIGRFRMFWLLWTSFFQTAFCTKHFSNIIADKLSKAISRLKGK